MRRVLRAFFGREEEDLLRKEALFLPVLCPFLHRFAPFSAVLSPPFHARNPKESPRVVDIPDSSGHS